MTAAQALEAYAEAYLPDEESDYMHMCCVSQQPRVDCFSRRPLFTQISHKLI